MDHCLGLGSCKPIQTVYCGSYRLWDTNGFYVFKRVNKISMQLIPYVAHKTQNIYYVNLYRKSLLTHACARKLSRVWLFAIPWTVACQAFLSMGFSRQEYWSGLPFPPSGISQPRDQTLISCWLMLGNKTELLSDDMELNKMLIT